MINLAVLLAFSGEFGRAGEVMARCSQMRCGSSRNGKENYGPKEDVLHGDGTCGGTGSSPLEEESIYRYFLSNFQANA